MSREMAPVLALALLWDEGDPYGGELFFRFVTYFCICSTNKASSGAGDRLVDV